MVVIPLERARRRAKPTFAHPLNRPAPIRGTFQAPSGRPGTMTGLLRLHRLVQRGDRLQGIVFFTGDLSDGDGSHVGVASRRMIVSAEIVRSASGIHVSIGPLEVDLLGFAVSVEAVTMQLGTAVPGEGSETDSARESARS